MLEHIILPLLLYMDFGGISHHERIGKDCLMFNSGTSVKQCNRVCNLQPITDVDIVQVKEYFGTKPFTWVVSSQNKSTHEALKKNDLIYKGDFLAMTALNTNIQPTNENALSVSITQVGDIESFDNWLELVALSYNYDKEELRNAVIHLKLIGKDHVILYSGLKNNILVTACMAIQHSNCITIHMLATHDQYRKQGFATYLLQACIKDAKTKGYQETLLLTSANIKSLYSSMGFTESNLYYIYSSV